jgi:hypothetical protein
MFKLNKARAALAVLASIALALGVAVSAPSAQAASTDVYFMPYNPVSGGNYQYTYVINSGSTTQDDILVGPATGVSTAYGVILSPSYFSDQTSANLTATTVFANDGISSATITNTSEQPATSEWQVRSRVRLGAPSSTYGPVSIRYCNPTPASCTTVTDASTNVTNITVARLASSTVASESSISVRIYDPADSTGATYYSASGQTVLSNTFYESLNINYPSGIDLIVQVYYNQTIPELTHVSWGNVLGVGDQIKAMTVAGIDYEDDLAGRTGWLYGVYRPISGTLQRIDIAKYVGTDVYRLYADDVVVWKYGQVTNYDVLFPTTI